MVTDHAGGNPPREQGARHRVAVGQGFRNGTRPNRGLAPNNRAGSVSRWPNGRKSLGQGQRHAGTGTRRPPYCGLRSPNCEPRPGLAAPPTAPWFLTFQSRGQLGGPPCPWGGGPAALTDLPPPDCGDGAAWRGRGNGVVTGGPSSREANNYVARGATFLTGKPPVPGRPRSLGRASGGATTTVVDEARRPNHRRVGRAGAIVEGGPWAAEPTSSTGSLRATAKKSGFRRWKPGPGPTVVRPVTHLHSYGVGPSTPQTFGVEPPRRGGTRPNRAKEECSLRGRRVFVGSTNIGLVQSTIARRINVREGKIP